MRRRDAGVGELAQYGGRHGRRGGPCCCRPGPALRPRAPTAGGRSAGGTTAHRAAALPPGASFPRSEAHGQHAVRGADEAITNAIDRQLEARDDDDDESMARWPGRAIKKLMTAKIKRVRAIKARGRDSCPHPGRESPRFPRGHQPNGQATGTGHPIPLPESAPTLSWPLSEH